MPQVNPIQPVGGGGVSIPTSDCTKAAVTGDGSASTPLKTTGVIGLGDGCTGVVGSSVSGDGVDGSSTGGIGVSGNSHDNAGVQGISVASWGVRGQTPSATAGVRGESGAGAGVWGVSSGSHGIRGSSGKTSGASPPSGCGVWGDSHNGSGVCGTSANSFGLWAKGSPAGHFAGDVEITGNLNHGGNMNLTGGDINLSGGSINVQNGGDVVLSDCAEDFDVGDEVTLDAGTVVVLTEHGTVEQCGQGYDKRAAGVVSGGGIFRPAIVLGRQASSKNSVPIALLGKVYCKVDAEYSPIEVGDLLTSSPTPGHAMRAGDPLKAFGSVIGKALAAQRAGLGLIPILVALQ